MMQHFLDTEEGSSGCKLLVCGVGTEFRLEDEEFWEGCLNYTPELPKNGFGWRWYFTGGQWLGLCAFGGAQDNPW